MGDNDKTTTTTAPQDNPASNAPDAAAADTKGKGKSVEDSTTQELSMDDEDEESDEGSGPEDIVPDADDEEDEHDNLEPISSENIISGGRRTRGKNIDFAEAAEKTKNEGGDEMDDDEEDEDFAVPNEDEKTRDN